MTSDSVRMAKQSDFQSTDSLLIKKFARQGDERAFNAIYERHKDMVYGVCVRKLQGDEHLARDVLQTIFLKLAQKPPVDVKNLGGFLRKDALFRCNNLKVVEGRNARKSARLAEEMRGQTRVNPVRQREIAETIETVLLEFPETDRDLVLRHYYEGRRINELARELGCGAATLRARLFRVRERIRKAFKRHGIEAPMSAWFPVLMKLKNRPATKPPLNSFKIAAAKKSPAAVNTAQSYSPIWGWKGIFVLALVTPLPLLLVLNQQPKPAASTAPTLRVVDVKGEVMARTGDQQAWRPLRAADALPADGSIKTTPDANIVLCRSDHSLITLREDSELTFHRPPAADAANPALHSFRLKRGAAVCEAVSPLQLQAANTKLDAKDAVFRVMIAEADNPFVRAETVKGRVELEPEGPTPNRHRLAAGEAVCALQNGTVHSMPADQQEFSPKHGGIFFRSAIDAYTKQSSSVLDARRARLESPFLNLTPEQLVDRLQLETGLKTKLAASATTKRPALLLANQRRQAAAALLPVSLDDPAAFGGELLLENIRGNVKFDLRGMADHHATFSSELRRQGVLPQEKFAFRPINKMSFMATQVGRLPDGTTLHEVATNVNGKRADTRHMTGSCRNIAFNLTQANTLTAIHHLQLNKLQTNSQAPRQPSVAMAH